MIFGALLIPIVVIVLLMVFFKKHITWWEYLLTIGIPLVFIVVFKLGVEKAQVVDTEYWGGYITQAQYFEDWDEKVSCRHPKYCTRPVTRTRTDSKGRTSTYTTTETYQCGWQHPYDVDYHPPYWEVDASTGESFSTTVHDYQRLVNKFGNQGFVDLHRNYHSNDGDKYVTRFDGSDARLEAVTSTHTYENRVQAAHSVYNFKDVSEKEKKEYGLYDYPAVQGYRCFAILGDAGPNTNDAKWQLDFWNGKLGQAKQVRMWILIYKNQPRMAAELQEAYWKGGNKNEFILAIGVNDKYHVNWVHPISWTPAEDLKIDARNYVSMMDSLNISKVINWLGNNVQTRYDRKHFKEFSYLTVEPPTWAIITTYIVTLLLSIGWAWFAVRNDIDPDDKDNSRHSRPSHYPYI